MYRIKVEHNGSKLNYITYVDDNKDLGHFLLNLNGEYEIISISKTNYDELKKKEEFLFKNPDIEFGKGKEV